MENADLVNTYLNVPYEGVISLLTNLRGFYKELTGYENPFLIQPDDVTPEQRIHFLCRTVTKELDLQGTPAYFQIVTDLFKGSLQQGEMMYAPRMVDMFIESLKSIPDDISLSSLFEGSDCGYELYILPYIQKHRREDLPRVTGSIAELRDEILRKEALSGISDEERSKSVEVLNSRVGAAEARAQEVEAHSVEKLFKNQPNVIANIRKNAPELLTSPCIGLFKFMDFEDEMDYVNSAIAIFTEDNMAFIPKRLSDGLFKKAGKNYSWSLSSIESLSIGDEHSRVNFGFDSNDWQKIHLTWRFKGGSVITSTICSGMSRDESQTFFNQRVLPLLQQLANYFPVKLDGGHIERTSGYRTVMSYGVWF